MSLVVNGAIARYCGAQLIASGEANAGPPGSNRRCVVAESARVNYESSSSSPPRSMTQGGFDAGVAFGGRGFARGRGALLLVIGDSRTNDPSGVG